MGKRNTAKTGDKALYNAREKQDNSHNSNAVENDDMYNEVDRYNNARDELQDDMLTFDKKDDSDEEGVLNDVEGVMDLGLDQSTDESDSDGSEEGSSDEDEPSPRRPLQTEQSDDDDDDDDDDDSIEDFNEDETDVLNWGKRKRDYYHGDTADLEIMERKEAVEDAELEEEGAKEVLKARMEGMTEDDFMLDNDDDDSDDDKVNEKESGHVVEMMTDEMQSTKRRKLSKLSKKDKIKLMNKTHPELLPLVSHFRDGAIRPCAEKTSVVVNALLHSGENAEAVGATNTGLQYLLTKAMIQTATALNVCQYLMIKTDLASSALNDEDSSGFNDEDVIKNHPVISRLNQLNHLTDKLESKVESKVNNLNNQFENLVKASGLMQDVTDEDEEDDVTSENSMKEVANVNDIDYDTMLAKGNSNADSDTDDNESAASSSEDEEEDAVMQKRLMNEARFALRKQDDEENHEGGSKRRRRRAVPSFSDFGDEDNADEVDLAAAGKSLATTINRISQRSKSGEKVSAAPEVNDEVDEDRFNRGLEMMEAELGGDNKEKGNEIDADSVDEDGDDFYSQIQKKSKARKEFKKNLYAVAPKYPGLDNEIEGERAVGNMIMKNRGLVAHKNRLNRNPRVKKREQYRKALIKRKGAVREVRTDEGHKYGGETTGVKSGISRSRKLGVK